MGSGGSGNLCNSDVFYILMDHFEFWNYFNSAYQGRKITNAKFRDTNGFYHIVFRVDTTSATASERMRIYVNGEQKHSFGTNDATITKSNF